MSNKSEVWFWQWWRWLNLDFRVGFHSTAEIECGNPWLTVFYRALLCSWEFSFLKRFLNIWLQLQSQRIELQRARIIHKIWFKPGSGWSRVIWYFIPVERIRMSWINVVHVWYDYNPFDRFEIWIVYYDCYDFGIVIISISGIRWRVLGLEVRMLWYF